MMTYRSSYNPPDKTDYSNFAFKKSEILDILKILNSNFSFDEDFQESNQKNYKDFFYNYDVFNGFEIACLIGGYDPNQLTINQTRSVTWRNENPTFVQALGLVLSADKENGLFKYDQDSHSYEFDYTISNADLKKYLISKNIIISGFNDLLQQDANIVSSFIMDISSEQFQQLSQENEALKIELVQAQERIKQLETIQQDKQLYFDELITPEQEIPNARQRNNVLKIISILSEMAGLPPEPFTAFNMMDAHATQNGKEIPSKHTIADWLKRARDSN